MMNIAGVILTVTIVAKIMPTQACHYKGREYLSGETIDIDEPCLSCTCKGALICSLRVCPKLPDPPPQGCVSVHKKHQCCPQIVCNDLNEVEKPRLQSSLITLSNRKGCIINGSSYSEGSALPSSSLCELCYCLRGQQSCISPHCSPPSDHCTPTLSPYSCCPVHYNCSQPFTVRKIEDSVETGCTVNGRRFSEGEMVENGNLCSTCYCISGEVKCQPVRCTIHHVEGCYPVYLQDRCCPVAYNCSSSETHQPTIERSLNIDEPIQESTTEFSTPETSTVLETTTDMLETSTTEDVTEDTTVWTDQRFASTQYEETSTSESETTTHSMPTTTDQEEVTLPTRTAIGLRMDDSEAKNPPKVAENSTHTADEDYEAYDYSDAKLPPSLPNLVIFPFVAADAVTKTKDKEPAAEEKIDSEPMSQYYSPFFTHPLETQGGFVPKEGPSDDPITYQPIYFDDKVAILAEAIEPLDETTSLTTPPTSKSEKCLSEGIEYAHGERLPPIVECIDCVCQYGDIMCEETQCPPPPPGCHMKENRIKESCCPEVVCDSPVIEESLQPPLNSSGFTLEPIITTNHPDVIRAEAAPDLSSLMKEVTHRPMITVSYADEEVSFYPNQQTTETDALKVSSESSGISSSVSPVYQPSTVSIISAAEEPIAMVSDTPETNLCNDTQTESSTESQIHLVNTTEATTVSSKTELQKSTTTTFENLVNTSLANATENYKVVTTSYPERKTTLLGVKQKTRKNSTTTTESGSFLDEFLKGFFESAEEKASTSKMHHIYSSQLRSPEVLSTTAMPSVEVIQNNNGTETETGSFSLDSVLDMLFKAEATEAPKIKPNSTKITKPSRKTKKTTTTTTPLPKTTRIITTTEMTLNDSVLQQTSVASESSFVTHQDTGFAKINILNQEKTKVPVKHKEKVGKQPESLRKPTKVAGNIGGMLKLAGCNIYGRMYRVGKIIVELTNNCVECMCTESGVQCTKGAC